MKRILTLLSVALVVVAIVVVTAMPAFGAPRLNGGDDKCRNSDHNHCVNNNDQGFTTNHGGQQQDLNGPRR